MPISPSANICRVSPAERSRGVRLDFTTSFQRERPSIIWGVLIVTLPFASVQRPPASSV